MWSLECKITTSCDTLNKDVSSASPIDTATLLPRRSCTHTHTHTHTPSETPGMSQSATPATPIDITTSCNTLKRITLSSFPHKQGEASDSKRHTWKTSIPFETSSNFDTCWVENPGFPSRFQENLKVATSKSMCLTRFPPNFITSHKIPHLPRNLHFVTTSCSPDTAIRRKDAT